MNITKDYESIPSIGNFLANENCAPYLRRKAYQNAVANLDAAICRIPLNYDELHDDHDCYLLPVNRATILFLEKLFLNCISENMACDESPQTITDNLIYCLTQAKHELHAQPFISIYEVNECYGGPEEGGWWYWTWTLESTRSIPHDEVADYLRQLLEDYSSMSDNCLSVSELNFDHIYSQYLDFRLDTQNQINNYKQLDFTTVGDFANNLHHTREARLWKDNTYHAHTEIMVVFEWAPGMLSTTHRPQYC